jgi:hypothetical protein
VPAHRLVIALLLGGALGILATPACSSSSTNEEEPEPSCTDAGDDCAPCCIGVVGSLAETAYKVQARACVCDEAPLFCEGPCADLCTSDFVTGACVVCLRTVGATCMNNHCTQDDCKSFQSCLGTCK